HLRDTDQLACIDAIGEHAAQQGQGELGHETAQMNKTELRLRARDLEREPSQRECKHMLADDLRDQSEPVKPKVAHLEREEGIGFLFRGCRGSRCYVPSLPHQTATVCRRLTVR